MTISNFAATPAAIDADTAYRACSGREARFDGRLYLGVTSTGIYCRPSCPARTPRREHCRFFPTAAASVAAGFRACKRCRPDALPGTRDWDSAGDLVARALRRIRDGALDGRGPGTDVAGLAEALHVSERQLRRLVVEATGATPVQLATTRRAALARQLIEQTDLSLADIAFAAGFSSVRRFNDTMRTEFGVAPSALHRGRGSAADTRERTESVERPSLTLRLRYRGPFAVAPLRAFLGNHAVPGLERSVPAIESTSHGRAPLDDDNDVDVDAAADDRSPAHERVVPVPGGLALARIRWPRKGATAARQVREASGAPATPDRRDADAAITVHLDLPRLDDLMPAIVAVRRWLDLDADPMLVDDALRADARLAPLVAATPGIRIPGSAAPVETALMVVLGQQVSVKAALTVQGRCAAAYGDPALQLGGGVAGGSAWLAPPDPARIAEDGVARVRERLGIDGNRATALVELAGALAGGLALGVDADRARVREQLIALPRIGPWSADLIALRCLGDPDIFASGDLVARRALATLTGAARLTPRAAEIAAQAWRPWRSYALVHLWSREYHV